MEDQTQSSLVTSSKGTEANVDPFPGAAAKDSSGVSLERSVRPPTLPSAPPLSSASTSEPVGTLSPSPVSSPPWTKATETPDVVLDRGPSSALVHPSKEAALSNTEKELLGAAVIRGMSDLQRAGNGPAMGAPLAGPEPGSVFENYSWMSQPGLIFKKEEDPLLTAEARTHHQVEPATGRDQATGESAKSDPSSIDSSQEEDSLERLTPDSPFEVLAEVQEKGSCEEARLKPSPASKERQAALQEPKKSFFFTRAIDKGPSDGSKLGTRAEGGNGPGAEDEKPSSLLDHRSPDQPRVQEEDPGIGGKPRKGEHARPSAEVEGVESSTMEVVLEGFQPTLAGSTAVLTEAFAPGLQDKGKSILGLDVTLDQGPSDVEAEPMTIPTTGAQSLGEVCTVQPAQPIMDKHVVSLAQPADAKTDANAPSPERPSGGPIDDFLVLEEQSKTLPSSPHETAQVIKEPVSGQCVPRVPTVQTAAALDRVQPEPLEVDSSGESEDTVIEDLKGPPGQQPLAQKVATEQQLPSSYGGLQNLVLVPVINVTEIAQEQGVSDGEEAAVSHVTSGAGETRCQPGDAKDSQVEDLVGFGKASKVEDQRGFTEASKVEDRVGFGKDSQVEDLVGFGKDSQVEDLVGFGKASKVEDQRGFTEASKVEDRVGFGKDSQVEDLVGFGKDSQVEDLVGFGKASKVEDQRGFTEASKVEDRVGFGKDSQVEDLVGFGKDSQVEDLVGFGKASKVEDQRGFTEASKVEDRVGFGKDSQVEDLVGFGKDSQVEDLVGFGKASKVEDQRGFTEASKVEDRVGFGKDSQVEDLVGFGKDSQVEDQAEVPGGLPEGQAKGEAAGLIHGGIEPSEVSPPLTVGDHPSEDRQPAAEGAGRHGPGASPVSSPVPPLLESPVPEKSAPLPSSSPDFRPLAETRDSAVCLGGMEPGDPSAPLLEMIRRSEIQRGQLAREKQAVLVPPAPEPVPTQSVIVTSTPVVVETPSIVVKPLKPPDDKPSDLPVEDEIGPLSGAPSRPSPQPEPAGVPDGAGGPPSGTVQESEEGGAIAGGSVPALEEQRSPPPPPRDRAELAARTPPLPPAPADSGAEQRDREPPEAVIGGEDAERRSQATVKDLIYWSDPKKTGVVFGSTLTLLVSLAVFSVVSVLAYLVLALLSVTISFRVYKSVIQAVQKVNDGNPFKVYLEQDITLSADTFRKYCDTTLVHVNRVLKYLLQLFLVQDLVDSLKLAVLMWLMTYVGAVFNGLTLLILAVLLTFSVPAVYKKYQKEIDHYVNLVQKQVCCAVGKIQEKLPGTKRKNE